MPEAAIMKNLAAMPASQRYTVNDCLSKPPIASTPCFLTICAEPKHGNQVS